MITKEKIIELIREGKLVVKTNGDFVNAGVLVDILEREHSGEDVEYGYIGLRYSYEDKMYYYFDDKRIILNREIITLQEYLDSPSEKDFQGSREYDLKLWNEYILEELKTSGHWCVAKLDNFLNNRYPNDSILKQIAEKEAEIEELRQQLKSK